MVRLWLLPLLVVATVLANEPQQIGKPIKNLEVGGKPGENSTTAEAFEPTLSPECILARSSSLTELTNGKKYLFIKSHGNWTESRDKCAELGLHLAVLKDRKDLKVLERKVNQFTDFSWWVSAKDEGSDGQLDFRWHDGSKLEQNSNFWDEGTNKTLGCVELRAMGNKLSGKKCSYKYGNSVCELPSECY
ncbi:C-type lectin domain family 7 member A-like [Neocloeon triangulifer]|uniref:C-type lectin domain family 7 member A-like n=1 Tax=Neocloeon triangulifer TaxID=2078957 RepID=UPI00286EED45|nr:C-type lectin domain family 7 member A-like [Neocloeon triangulifer]